MDPTVDAMLIVYAAALRRHQQHLEDACDRRAWHVLACHLIERAVWSANSTEESTHLVADLALASRLADAVRG
jgi:hypothetical protein